LRESHDTDGKDKASLGVECLALVIRQLVEERLAKEVLQLLIELEAVLRQQQSGESARERRRRGRAPSEAMLARVAVVIDLLVKAGYGEAFAAQLIMRKLLAAASRPRARVGCQRLEAPPPMGGLI
jgi:hypothetical protein